MRPYILVPALAALNWRTIPAATARSTEHPNNVARSIRSPTGGFNATANRRFEHNHFLRQYRAEDWASSPHGNRPLTYSHGAGKRSMGWDTVGKRMEGHGWFKSRGLVPFGSSRAGVYVREMASGGGMSEVEKENGKQGVCSRRGNQGTRGGVGVVEGLGPAKVQESETGGKSSVQESETQRVSAQGDESRGKKWGGGKLATQEGEGRLASSKGSKVGEKQGGGKSATQEGGTRHASSNSGVIEGKEGGGNSSVQGDGTRHASTKDGVGKGEGGKRPDKTRCRERQAVSVEETKAGWSEESDKLDKAEGGGTRGVCAKGGSRGQKTGL